MGAIVSIRGLPFLVLAFALAFIPGLPDQAVEGSVWIVIGAAILVMMYQLLRLYRRSELILCVLLFLFTYYLAPLPYLAFGISIVPYAINVSTAHFVKTWALMAVFLASLVFYSQVTAVRSPAMQPDRSVLRISTVDLGLFGTLFWPFVVAFIVLTFKGEAISNVSGSDNWDAYISNLQGQGGALEYFLLLMVIGRVIATTRFQKMCYWACILYYLYFCLTRGYRVQLLEMLLLVAGLNFAHRLSLRNVFIATVAGFFLMQALGFMKTGASDVQSLFTVMAGDQIRSNQTEVFYTSNNVLTTVWDGGIPWGQRIISLYIAFLAVFLPGSVLADSWQTTLAAQSVVEFPAGGGGFIAGHYYFWASDLGVIFCGLLVVCLFRLHERAQSQRTLLLTILLLATCPRWIAYEPVSMFFRLGLYFLIAYELLDRFRSTRIALAPQSAGVSMGLRVPPRESAVP